MREPAEHAHQDGTRPHHRVGDAHAVRGGAEPNLLLEGRATDPDRIEAGRLRLADATIAAPDLAEGMQQLAPILEAGRGSFCKHVSTIATRVSGRSRRCSESGTWGSRRMAESTVPGPSP